MAERAVEVSREEDSAVDTAMGLRETSEVFIDERSSWGHRTVVIVGELIGEV